MRAVAELIAACELADFGRAEMTVEMEQAPPPSGWPEEIEVRDFVPGQDERAAYEAVEDGGEISGVCLCKTIAGRGEVDVVAVRRPWRNRGLGLALLRHAFGEFYRRGVREVGLSVDAESTTGAPRLYGRAGMRVAQSYTLYQKELRSERASVRRSREE